jgi:transcription elongation factor Elf1
MCPTRCVCYHALSAVACLIVLLFLCTAGSGAQLQASCGEPACWVSVAAASCSTPGDQEHANLYNTNGCGEAYHTTVQAHWSTVQAYLALVKVYLQQQNSCQAQQTQVTQSQQPARLPQCSTHLGVLRCAVRLPMCCGPCCTLLANAAFELTGMLCIAVRCAAAASVTVRTQCLRHAAHSSLSLCSRIRG